VAAAALAVFDPHDRTSLYKESTGTNVVTADGDTVGFMGDCRAAHAAGLTFGAWMTANGYTPSTAPGNHAKQATGARRPLYKESGGLRFLLFDGLDDCLATANINLTGTSKVTCTVGVRYLIDGSQVAAETSAVFSSNAGAFILFKPSTAKVVSAGCAAASNTAASPASYTPPISLVQTGLFDFAVISTNLRLNGASVATSSGTATGGTGGNYALNMGARNNGGSAPLNGRLYGLILENSIASENTALFEQWANTRAQAY
jgi:hypothetical protein